MKPAIMIAVLMALFTSASAQTVYPSYQDGVVIFQLKTDKSVPLIPSVDGQVDFSSDPMLSRLDTKFTIVQVKQLYPNHDYNLLERTYQIDFANPSKIDEFIKDMAQYNAVEYVERKELHHTCLTPNDTYYSSNTWNGQWGLFQINAAQAWDISTGNANTVVAVTDNAMNVNHPDLVNKMLQGWDAVDSDTDPSPCGSNDGFHGSHVSGIVGAESNNSLGVASIGYNVSILPVKIGNCNGSLTAGYEGIIWAADNGADVINMSWGGSGYSNYGQNVCTYAWNQGAILIAAAGNDGVSSVFYPAGYTNVVSVASTTTGDSKSSFSNYGTWIDISAPGSSILSCNEGTGYQSTQGTSMASPMVAGLVGLMKSHAVGASNTDIINCLYSSADNIDAANSNYIGELGAGRINAHQAMICASSFAFQVDAAITDIASPEGTLCSGTYTPEVVLTNSGSNTLTSATITYQVSGSSAQTYNWTGSLTTGQSATITLPSITSASGNYTFTATSSAPNGGTDQNAANDSQNSNFTIVTNGEQVTLDILADCYGSEITWEIVDDQSNVVASGGPYSDVTGGQLESHVICLATGCYTFNIEDTYGDGLYGSQWSCTVDGDYSMEDSGGNTLFAMTAANGDFGYGTSHNFCIAPPVANCPEINVSSSNAQCNGAADGSITITATNGVAPLTYSLDNVSYVSNNVFTGLADGTYMAYVKGDDGCVDSMSVTISEPSALSVSTSTQDEVCGQGNGEISISASGGTGAYQYSLDGGNNYSSSATFAGLTAGNYNVMILDDNGCTTAASATVGTSGGNFTLSTSGDASICFGGTATISASGVPAGGNYSWDQGLGTGGSHSVAPGSTTTYTVTGTDAGGCSQTQSITVTVNTLPIVIAGASTTNALVGESINFTSNGSNANNYDWDFGDGGMSSSPDDNYTYTAPGVYTVLLTGESNGCTSTAEITVTIDDASSVDENTWGLRLYPNPSNGLVNLALETEMAELELSLYDVSGKQVMAPVQLSGVVSHELNLSSLSGGVYFLQVSDGSDVTTKRITLMK